MAWAIKAAEHSLHLDAPMSLGLFSRCAGMSSSIGLRALASSHEMRWVGPLVVDTMGRSLVPRPALWVLMVLKWWLYLGRSVFAAMKLRSNYRMQGNFAPPVLHASKSFEKRSMTQWAPL